MRQTFSFLQISNCQHCDFSRNQGSGRQENEQEKYVRLFVIVPKDMSEDDLRNEFEKYGELENISVIKDKVTKERKGFAYVKYTKSVELKVRYGDLVTNFLHVLDFHMQQKHLRVAVRSSRQFLPNQKHLLAVLKDIFQIGLTIEMRGRHASMIIQISVLVETIHMDHSLCQ